MSYPNIPVPALIGINEITVTATNNDKDYEHDQETITESQWVEIFADLTPPIIDHPEDIEYEYTASGNSIIWTALDDHPDTYTVMVDGGLYDSGTWESGMPITIDVDGLSMEPHEFLISVLDFYDNLATDSVIVNVTDDDDISEPIITIQYDGSGTVNDPGWWSIYVEDPESGLDEVQILINGVQELYDQGLSGTLFKSYDILVPDIAGEYTLTVVAKNNDHDWDGDQEQDTETDWVEIIFDDDWTAPIISIEDLRKGWNVFIDDLESGIDEVLIDINGTVYFHDVNLNGIISLSFYNLYPQGDPGIYTITVTAINNDKDYEGDQEMNTMSDSIKTIGVLVIKDDDFTAPVILIAYEGDYTETNPGTWHIDVEDLESGLDEVRIWINGVEQIYDQNLEGIISMHYDILVPDIAGIYTINVTAINNDKDTEYDQESYTKYQIVDINPETVPPSDDDITGPTILIDYVPDDYNPYYEGVWRIYIEDLESGLDCIQIILDGIDFIYDSNLNGIISKFYQIDAVIWKTIHTIEVNAVNYDKDYPGDEELSTAFDSMCVDDTPPTIVIHYIGGSIETESGIWYVEVDDLESGIDEIQIIIDGDLVTHDFTGELSIVLEVNVPSAVGIHTIEVIAFNNDKDQENDQESSSMTHSVEIDEFIPPPPPIYDENLGGILSISYTGDTGGVETPTSVGIHTIEVIAFNNDKDYEGDQESSYYMETIEIIPDPIFGI